MVHPPSDPNASSIKPADSKGPLQSVNGHEFQDLGYTLQDDDSSEGAENMGKTKVSSYHSEVRLKDTHNHPYATQRKGQLPKQS